MTTTNNIDLKLTKKDFIQNWEKSPLLTELRYEGLTWIGELLYTEYSAIYQNSKIVILVK